MLIKGLLKVANLWGEIILNRRPSNRITTPSDYLEGMWVFYSYYYTKGLVFWSVVSVSELHKALLSRWNKPENQVQRTYRSDIWIWQYWRNLPLWKMVSGASSFYINSHNKYRATSSTTDDTGHTPLWYITWFIRSFAANFDTQDGSVRPPL